MHVNCKDMTYLCVTYLKPQRTSKQASEWKNVSDSCAGTDVRVRGAEEEHDGYQQRLNHTTLRHVHVYKSSAYFPASK